MKKQTISTVHTINIVFQAIITLVVDIGIFVLIGWLATTYWGAERWIYIPLILGGVTLGFISMVKFVLSAMKGLERLEAQHKSDENKARASGKPDTDAPNTNDT